MAGPPSHRRTGLDPPDRFGQLRLGAQRQRAGPYIESPLIARSLDDRVWPVTWAWFVTLSLMYLPLEHEVAGILDPQVGRLRGTGIGDGYLLQLPARKEKKKKKKN